MGVTVEVSGLESLSRELKALSINMKEKVVKEGARKAAAILVAAERSEVPVSENAYKNKKTGKYNFVYKRKYGATPGNLKRSLGIIAQSKLRNKNLVLVSARTGRDQNNDGYYGDWVEHGTSIGQRPNRFVQRALDKSRFLVMAKLKESVKDSIKKYS